MQITTRTKEPIYVRVQRELMRKLKDDGLEPGSKIPSERELSSQFGASRMTMRKAVEKLVERGLLERRGTSGTYLPERLFARPLSQETPFGITKSAQTHGRTSGSRLLYFEKLPASEPVAGYLKIAAGEPVIVIRRQRTIDGIPVCIELSHIPAALVPGLSAADVVENPSLYKLFSTRYRVELYNGDAKLSVGWLTEDEAELLDLSPDTAILEFEAVSVLKDDVPFEYLRSINHPRHVSFHISGSKNGVGPAGPDGFALELVKATSGSASGSFARSAEDLSDQNED